MKVIRKIAALLLVMAMVLTVTGCLHQKDEIAVTVGDAKFTSAYYMCALINARTEAQAKVMENLTEEEQETQEFDVYSKQIDGKKYVDWIEARAIEIIKENAAYRLLCKQNNVELTKEELSNVEANASLAWYGDSSDPYTLPEYLYFDPDGDEGTDDNGVSYKTYLSFRKDLAYKEKYFDSLYSKDGKNAISDEDVKKTIYENFVIADVLDAAYEEGADDESKAALKTKLEAYAKELQEGKKTFEQVYADYNNEENHSHENDAEDGPKDAHAAVFGTEATKYVFGEQVIDYNTSYYSKINSMKVGEAVVMDNKDGTGLVLFFKRDITADPYYVTNLDINARHIIADEDFAKILEDYMKNLKPEINDYAIGQFDVEDIKDPYATE